MEKTNVMRILDQKKIHYTPHSLDIDTAVSGVQAAHMLGINPSSMFKTLVTVGKRGTHYVFVIPVNRELDLKKCALAVKEKSVEMVKAKELLPLTGYIHGGCSPIGMKKLFTTTVDSSAQALDKIYFSAGKIGRTVELSPNDLLKVIRFRYADIAVEG